MSNEHNALLTETITANGPLIAHRFVSLEYSLPSLPGVGIIGVAMTDAADGELCPVTMIGTAPIVLGDNVVAGQVMTDAEGRAILWQPGGVTDNFAAGFLLIPRGIAGTLGQVRKVLIRPDRN